jgi:hypothetical protein
MLCCPSCAIQYLDSVPADSREQERRSCEKNFHFLVGEKNQLL